MSHFRTYVLCMLCAWACVISRAAAQQRDPFQTDLQQLSVGPSRLVGSEGYASAQRYLERQMQLLPNVELRRQRFRLMVPVTRSAALAINGTSQPIFPFWPAELRTCSTPAQGITGRLVYVGQCTPEQLKPASLAGQIAVVEASAGDRWDQPFMMGAAAELVLGNGQTNWFDLKSHDLRIPVNFPRYYVPAGALADELRSGRSMTATVRASVSWEPKEAVNEFALIRPSRGAPHAAAHGGALVFSVPLDSTSLVPDLSPGASQAVQAAAGLALVRHFSQQVPDRPVMVFFSSGDGIQFQGTRNMLLALANVPSSWDEELAQNAQAAAGVAADLAAARSLAGAAAPWPVHASSPLLNRVFQLIDSDLADQQDALFRLRTSEEESSSSAAGLERRQQSLQTLKFDLQQASSAVPEAWERVELRRYLQRVIVQLAGQGPADGLQQQLAQRGDELRQRAALYRWLAEAEGKQTDPQPPGTANRLIDLLVGLDLSDHGSRVGPMFFGAFQRASAFGQIQTYNDWFGQLQRSADASGPAWWAKVRPAVDLSVLSQLQSPSGYLASPLPVGSELAMAWGVPGFSMVTLDDLRLRRDTPTDTLANLEIKPIESQLNAVIQLFSHLWNDPKLRAAPELKQDEVSFGGQVVGAAPGRPVPDLPRGGFLASYQYITSTGTSRRIPPLGMLPWTLGIRRVEVQPCDAEGNYLFEGLPRLRSDRLEGTAHPTPSQNDMQVFAVNVAKVDRVSGAIIATSDMGKAAAELHWSIDIKQDSEPLRNVAFDCEEFSLAGLYDPRFLQNLGEVLPLDARRVAEPQHFGMWLDNQMLAGFLEPGVRADLLVRYGRIGNRLILINMPAPSAPAGDAKAEAARRTAAAQAAPAAEARGYTAAQFNHLGWLPLATARDFWRLDELRLNDYRHAGVSSRVLDQLHQQAKVSLAEADRARRADDGAGLVRSSTAAWASEARVYDAAQDMARDVVRGALFLLILCVPFAFVMERLLIASPNVYRQIAGMAGIFALMAVGLWAFHPAFKISTSPLIIILAFAIISMSCLVIWVVYGKFDTELKRLRSGRGSAQGPSFASAGVLGSAVLLGIANMRKRRLRTTLTSVTIVLITFVLLWFTSSTHYLGTSTVATGVASSHSGVMLRQRGFRPMPTVLADQLRAVLADPQLQLHRPPQVVEAWWAVSVVDPREQYDLAAVPAAAASFKPSAGTKSGGTKAARVSSVPAVLGLTPGESQLSDIAQVIGPAKFARLEHGEQKIIYLSSAKAAELKVSEGGQVRLGGIALQVAGVFDADAFDRRVAMLSGESLLPLKYSSGALDTGGQQLDESTSESLDLNGDASSAEAGSVYEHLSAQDVAIVPASICQMLRNSTLRTVGLRLENQQQVQRVSDDLSQRYALAVFAGYDDGVRLVSAGNLDSVTGVSQVIVPLLIAGMIIFNTMMGSIAERRREIHVFTSLGLAPMHVGALFVAEAMTYGLVGTVFGYILGQGLGTLLLKLGWLGSITLNYSGTSAILTMGLVLLIVLLSALVPAHLATRIAAPSLDRSWEVPAPHDGVIRAELPFTINKTAAAGALAYLLEYFSWHQEGSIGKFAADHIKVIPYEEVAGQQSRALGATVWLTPYDLGVRQEVSLLIHPGPDADIYQVHVLLRRLSGDDRSWHRMNKPFLTELRKQFLAWRSLPLARMQYYVQQSRQLLGGDVDARTQAPATAESPEVAALGV